MDDFELYCWTIKGLLLSYMVTIYLVFSGDKTPKSSNIYQDFIVMWNPHFKGLFHETTKIYKINHRCIQINRRVMQTSRQRCMDIGAVLADD